MKGLAIFVVFSLIGCEYCEWWDCFCNSGGITDTEDTETSWGQETEIEDTDTGGQYGCENIGPEGGCLCYCEEHTCLLQNCIYYEDIGEVSVNCYDGEHCQLLCDPIVNSECQFSICMGELLYCSHFGYACSEWCPNT